MFEGATQFDHPAVGELPEEVTVLHVDDDQSHLELTADCLERTNDSFTVVSESDPRAVVERVESVEPDCIVSDYDMPRLDGFELYAELQAAGVDYPFILFTGKGSESIAAEAMSAGVTDYFQKGGIDTYELLANRIVEAVKSRQSRRLAQSAIEHYTELVETSHLPVYQYDRDGTIHYANEPAADLYGVDSTGELIGREMGEFLTTTESETAAQRLAALADDESVPPAEFRIRGADGHYRTVRVTCAPTPHTEETVGQTIAHDVTDRQHEQDSHQFRDVVSTVLDRAPAAIWSYDVESDRVSRYGVTSLLGVEEPALGFDFPSFLNYVHVDDRERVADEYRHAIEARESATLDFRVVTDSGDVRHIIDRISVVTGTDGHATHVTGFIQQSDHHGRVA